jgi:hypothetical protein
VRHRSAHGEEPALLPAGRRQLWCSTVCGPCHKYAIRGDNASLRSMEPTRPDMPPRWAAPAFEPWRVGSLRH